MKCNTCDTHVDCNATLYVNESNFYILAHYGSKHDMQRFALKLDKYKTGNICDECIDKLIKDGKAWVIEDGVW